MKGHNNTWTIVRKEFARFFGDRQLMFTTIIMPGLLIYLVYSLMGVGLRNIENNGADNLVTVQVENMPQCVAALFATNDSNMVVVQQSFGPNDIEALREKELNSVLVRFPAGFDSLVACYSPHTGTPAPNVEIYYNAANNASSLVFNHINAALEAFESSQSNLFDINRSDNEGQVFDMSSVDQMLGDILGKLIPMLILMMLFSGVMAIAPSSIAGEKERGTIATLLVTPMRRNELALGKIISLSGIALLSGVSSFLGIALSLPKMITASAEEIDIPLNYTSGDYVALLMIIFATVLIMASVVSLLSACAKDVKNAGTLITPFSVVIMLIGLLPMLQTNPDLSIGTCFIPFYNSIQVMGQVLSHTLDWTMVSVTLCANILYTGAAIWVLTRLFNSEKVMFSR